MIQIILKRWSLFSVSIDKGYSKCTIDGLTDAVTILAYYLLSFGRGDEDHVLGPDLEFGN